MADSNLKEMQDWEIRNHQKKMGYIKVCPVCKNEYNKGTRFCSYCQTRLSI